MLIPAEAQQRLKQWQVDDSQASAAPAFGRLATPIGKLPKDLSRIASDIYGLNDKLQQRLPLRRWRPAHSNRGAAIELDQLDADERTKLFAGVFPSMATEVNRTWERLREGPYQFGSHQKAFRVPCNPEHSLWARLDWLISLSGFAQSYEQHILTPSWLACWAPHIETEWGSQNIEIGRLAYPLIDAGGKPGEEMFDILAQSLRNQHEIGAIGQHVIAGLLMSSQPNAWELIERALLAAQRDEGLRKSILEVVDLAHPQAFCRMLRLILEHNLVRFSAVARAVNVWFAFRWDSASAKKIDKTLEQTLGLLEDESARRKAIAGDDAESAYLALWATAYLNAVASIPLAEQLLKHKSPGMRFVSVTHLNQLRLPQAETLALTASDDEDLRVALCAVPSVPAEANPYTNAVTQPNGLFDALDRVGQRLPDKPIPFEPIVWPWTEQKVSRGSLKWRLIHSLQDRPPTLLLPYLSGLDSWQRDQVVQLFAKERIWTAEERQALLRAAGDAAISVRAAAFAALSKLAPEAAEVELLEAILMRKAADLRVGSLALLLALPDADAAQSAERLAHSKDANQRAAGLELQRLLRGQNRLAGAKSAEPKPKRPSKAKGASAASPTAAPAQECEVAALTLENALGLMDPRERTPIVPPQSVNAQLVTPAAIEVLKELDQLIHEHREASFLGRLGSGRQLLGACHRGGFPHPNYFKKPERQLARLPLNKIWEKWYVSRSDRTRDSDGCELVRADCWWECVSDHLFKDWRAWASQKPYRQTLLAPFEAQERPKLQYPDIVEAVLDWLVFLHRPEARNDFLLDVIETICAAVPKQEIQSLVPLSPSGAKQGSEIDDDQREGLPLFGWRSNSGLLRQWLRPFLGVTARCSATQTVRLWRLCHWLDQPVSNAPRARAPSNVLLDAYSLGAANLHDVADELLGPRVESDYGFGTLRAFTCRRADPASQRALDQHPELKTLVERASSIIVESELARGDAPTAASAPAFALGSVSGIGTLLRILCALGKDGFRFSAEDRRGMELYRPHTLSHLAQVSHPLPDETPEQFAVQVRSEIAAKSFPEERLLQLAFLAPQWVRFVECYFWWEGLAEGLYWFLAHMRFMWGSNVAEHAAESAGYATIPKAEPEHADQESAEVSTSEGDPDDDGFPGNDEKQLSPWDRLILERSTLSAAERGDGAIDVAWLRRVYPVVGANRWEQLAAAARFASNAAQAKRAQLVADVLLGKAKLPELIAGIEKKYLKENVRLLGLYPLPAGTKRGTELARRFEVLQEYGRYCQKLSGLSKPEALRAFDVGLKNLAANAGYGDALRLDWALGAKRWADLRKGPVSVVKDGVTVTLSLNSDLRPNLQATRDKKELKSVPPAVKKDPVVADLLERCVEMRRQVSRQRQSLEAAMCRGDTFTGEEMGALSQHPLVAPLIERLVFVDGEIMGYPDKSGKNLLSHSGKPQPIKKSDRLRIAHSYDLLKSGEWSLWQRECFQAERLQPFRQVFRELYVVTKQEKADRERSLRYAGQQINPSQALALWGKRGWNTTDGIWKTYHADEVIANVTFQSGVGTPLEVEGFTIAAVEFYKLGEIDRLKLTDVPPFLFSEVMRDIDLVVSVAHRGGVDPEASASTVEMRASLVREMCALLKLNNVRLKPNHVLIDGKLGSYSIHLGGGTVHRMPGGSLCIVPVYAQHRGRLFLPFADDDPRTAEIASKVLLLARDDEIQDPTIIEQLRS